MLVGNKYWSTDLLTGEILFPRIRANGKWSKSWFLFHPMSWLDINLNVTGLNVPPANPQATPDLVSVHSLLSSNPWVLNEAIPTPTAFSSNANGHYNPERQLDPHHWAAALLHSSNISTEQGRIMVPDPGTPRLQEFQLLRADYESGCSYSNQRDSWFNSKPVSTGSVVDIILDSLCSNCSSTLYSSLCVFWTCCIRFLIFYFANNFS